MKKCPNCGSVMADDDVFCGQCGTRGVEVREPEPAPVAAGESAPAAADEPAPVAAGEPAPAAAGESAPAAVDEPAPVTADEPALAAVDEPASAAADEPAPAVEFQSGGQVCPSCGYSLMEGAAFCPNCGARVDAIPVAPAASADCCCPNCGERMEAGAAFCPNCGAMKTDAGWTGMPVPAEAVPAKKGNRRLIGILCGAGGAVLLAVLLIGLFMGPLASPSKKFISGQKKMLKSVGSFLSMAAKEADSLTSFSTDMTLTADTDNWEAARYLDDSAVDLKVDMHKDRLLVNADLTLMGSQVLSGAVTYDKGVVGVCVPELDDTYYVADLAQLMDSLGVDTDTQSVEPPQVDEAKLKKLFSRYSGLILETVNDDNVTKEDGKSFRLDFLGKKVKGQVYIFEPSAEDVEELLLKLADALEDDQELRDVVSEFLAGNEELAAQLTSGRVQDVEDQWDTALLDTAENLRDSAKDIGKRVERAGFRWSLGFQGGKVVMNRIELARAGNAVGYENLEGKAAVYYTQNGSRYMDAELEYEKDGGTYGGSVTVSSYGSPEASFDFDEVNLGKRSILGICYGEYELRDSQGDLLAALTVEKGEDGGTDHVVEINEIPQAGNLEVTLHTSDKRSTAAKPKSPEEDVSDYTQEDFQDLMDYLEGEASDLERDIMSDITSGYDW